MNQEHKELIGSYDFGEQCTKFLESEVGRYLLNRALTEIEAYHLQMEDKTEDIEECRVDIRARRLMFNWINEAIVAGEQAGEMLETAEDN